jgi:VIT1/CCC1 family predicted Fe2+/Mn2+ transporter
MPNDYPFDLPGNAATAAGRRRQPTPGAPALRRTGSWSGWPLFARILLWATRNNRRGASVSGDEEATTSRGLVSRMGWLRAAVLGADDGIVSVASIVVGVAAAGGTHDHVLLSGVAGLVAGAMSMAAGEFVSVSSQADIEKAELVRATEALRAEPEIELRELADIYVERGVVPALAWEVASQMTRHDALGAHARDELGLSEAMTARPIQAAFASATSFTLGGAAPLLVVLVAAAPALVSLVIAASLLYLGLLGAIGAHAGGAPIGKAVWRVAFWGALAMGVTAAVGNLAGGLGL